MKTMKKIPIHNLSRQMTTRQSISLLRKHLSLQSGQRWRNTTQQCMKNNLKRLQILENILQDNLYTPSQRQQNTIPKSRYLSLL